MLVFRLVTSHYSNDLNGTGASLYGGRWNSVGTPMLYTSAHRSLALCEMIVNLNDIQLRQDYDLITISLPDNAQHKKLSGRQIPKNWKQRIVQPETQVVGDQLAKEQKYLSLAVPSVVIPEEFNIIINPLHEDFHLVKIIERKQFIFDKRLF